MAFSQASSVKKRGAIMSKLQKNALLDLLEHERYREFGRQYNSAVVINKSATEIENFWSKASPLLNSKGPTKTSVEWMKSYWDCCRYAMNLAKLKTEIKDQSNPDAEVELTTGSREVDRIMSIVGWELAWADNNSEEKENMQVDQENHFDAMPARPRSPLSNWRQGGNHSMATSALGRASSPICTPMAKKRSLSPLSRCSSPISASPASSNNMAAAIVELSNAVTKISQAIDRNTKILQDLKASFDNAAVTIVDQADFGALVDGAGLVEQEQGAATINTVDADFEDPLEQFGDPNEESY